MSQKKAIKLLDQHQIKIVEGQARILYDLLQRIDDQLNRKFISYKFGQIFSPSIIRATTQIFQINQLALDQVLDMLKISQLDQVSNLVNKIFKLNCRALYELQKQFQIFYREDMKSKAYKIQTQLELKQFFPDQEAAPEHEVFVVRQSNNLTKMIDEILRQRYIVESMTSTYAKDELMQVNKKIQAIIRASAEIMNEQAEDNLREQEQQLVKFRNSYALIQIMSNSLYQKIQSSFKGKFLKTVRDTMTDLLQARETYYREHQRTFFTQTQNYDLRYKKLQTQIDTLNYQLSKNHKMLTESVRENGYLNQRLLKVACQKQQMTIQAQRLNNSVINLSLRNQEKGRELDRLKAQFSQVQFRLTEASLKIQNLGILNKKLQAKTAVQKVSVAVNTLTNRKPTLNVSTITEDWLSEKESAGKLSSERKRKQVQTQASRQVQIQSVQQEQAEKQQPNSSKLQIKGKKLASRRQIQQSKAPQSSKDQATPHDKKEPIFTAEQSENPVESQAQDQKIKVASLQVVSKAIVPALSHQSQRDQTSSQHQHFNIQQIKKSIRALLIAYANKFKINKVSQVFGLVESILHQDQHFIQDYSRSREQLSNRILQEQISVLKGQLEQLKSQHIRRVLQLQTIVQQEKRAKNKLSKNYFQRRQNKPQKQDNKKHKTQNFIKKDQSSPLQKQRWLEFLSDIKSLKKQQATTLQNKQPAKPSQAQPSLKKVKFLKQPSRGVQFQKEDLQVFGGVQGAISFQSLLNLSQRNRNNFMKLCRSSYHSHRQSKQINEATEVFSSSPAKQTIELNLNAQSIVQSRHLKSVVSSRNSNSNASLLQNQISKHQLSKIHKLFQFLKFLKENNRPSFNLVNSFLRYPYDCVFNKRLEACELSFDEFKRIYMRILQSHKKCGPQCSHLERFNKKIGYSLWEMRRHQQVRAAVNK